MWVFLDAILKKSPPLKFVLTEQSRMQIDDMSVKWVTEVKCIAVWIKIAIEKQLLIFCYGVSKAFGTSFYLYNNTDSLSELDYYVRRLGVVWAKH